MLAWGREELRAAQGWMRLARPPLAILRGVAASRLGGTVPRCRGAGGSGGRRRDRRRGALRDDGAHQLVEARRGDRLEIRGVPRVREVAPQAASRGLEIGRLGRFGVCVLRGRVGGARRTARRRCSSRGLAARPPGCSSMLFSLAHGGALQAFRVTAFARSGATRRPSARGHHPYHRPPGRCSLTGPQGPGRRPRLTRGGATCGQGRCTGWRRTWMACGCAPPTRIAACATFTRDRRTGPASRVRPYAPAGARRRGGARPDRARGARGGRRADGGIAERPDHAGACGRAGQGGQSSA